MARENISISRQKSDNEQIIKIPCQILKLETLAVLIIKDIPYPFGTKSVITDFKSLSFQLLTVLFWTTL